MRNEKRVINIGSMGIQQQMDNRVHRVLCCLAQTKQHELPKINALI